MAFVFPVLMLFAVYALSAAADVVLLRTGEHIKGRPLPERSDDKVLVMEDFVTGSLRTVAWNAVEPRDRERLLMRWRRADPALQPVAGHRIVLRLHDGSQTVLYGRVLADEGGHLHVMSEGKTLRLRKALVVGVSPIAMDPRDIWSPTQLVEQFLSKLRTREGADLDDLSARDHFRIAEYARHVEAFETARAHYAACAADPGFMHAKVAIERRKEMERRLREAAALKALRGIRAALRQEAFRRARKRIKAFAREYAEAGTHVQRLFRDTQRAFRVQRKQHFQGEARKHFPKVVQAKIGARVREKDVALRDVTAWARKGLIEEAFDALELRLHKRDDLQEGEARAFWNGRLKSSWSSVSYGSGTFIVEKARVRAPKGSKALSRDRWWKEASAKARAAWVLAWFVERSGLFQVMPDRKATPCARCAGKGLVSTRDGTKTVTTLCPRCGGTQKDRRVRYR